MEILGVEAGFCLHSLLDCLCRLLNRSGADSMISDRHVKQGSLSVQKCALFFSHLSRNSQTETSITSQVNYNHTVLLPALSCATQNRQPGFVVQGFLLPSSNTPDSWLVMWAQHSRLRLRAASIARVLVCIFLQLYPDFCVIH